jgi:hypothetical protein
MLSCFTCASETFCPFSKVPSRIPCPLSSGAPPITCTISKGRSGRRWAALAIWIPLPRWSVALSPRPSGGRGSRARGARRVSRCLTGCPSRHKKPCSQASGIAAALVPVHETSHMKEKLTSMEGVWNKASDPLHRDPPFGTKRPIILTNDTRRATESYSQCRLVRRNRQERSFVLRELRFTLRVVLATSIPEKTAVGCQLASRMGGISFGSGRLGDGGACSRLFLSVAGNWLVS